MPRPSTIDQLPDDIRALVNRLLRSPRTTQLEIIEQVNAHLEDRGEDARLTKGNLSRYAVRVGKFQERLERTQTISDQVMGKLGEAPTGTVGRLLTESIRGLIFEILEKIDDGDYDIDAGAVAQLALTVERLERAESRNIANVEAIEARVREQVKAEIKEQQREALAGIAPGAASPEALALVRQAIGLDD